MTIYADLNTYEGVGHSLDTITPSVGEYLGAVSRDVWNMAQSANRAYQLSQSVVGAYDIDDSEGGLPNLVHTPPPTPSISPNEQQEYIRDSGLEGHIKPVPGYTREALDIIIGRKKEELAIRETRSAAPWSYAPLGLVAGLGVSLADPVNVATAFFPLVGEARAFSLLRGASGAWGRAGIRAGIGALEGAAGSAAVEPTLRMAKTFEQADYDMLDTLLNIGFGTVFGAVLRPAAGAVGERLRARRGLRQPWNATDKTVISERLRLDMAARMENAFRAANPEADSAHVRQNALASAALFDARARAREYDTGLSVEDYYARYAPEFRVGEIGENVGAGVLEQARRRSDAATLEDFAHEARTNSAPSVFIPETTPDAVREKLGIDDLTIAVPDDFIRHLDNDHGRNADAYLAMTLDVLRRASDIESAGVHRAKARAAFGPRYSAAIYEEGRGRLVVFELLQSKKKGNRLVPVTAYEGGEEHIRAIVARKKPLPMDASIANGPVGQTPDNALQVQEAFESTLKQERGEGKPSSGEKAPRARVDFDADGRAMITFFKASDFSSAPHELYHIFRRDLAEAALDPNASPRAREQWAKIEEFVGAKPGQTWTTAMEEKFAQSGERFLLEGKAPTPALHDVFERLKQWFLEIYGNAEESGLPISEGMRRVFSDMLSMPVDDADAAFRYSLGRIATDDPSRDFSPSGGPDAFDQAVASGDMQAVRTLTDTSAARLQENMRGVSAADPEYATRLDREYRPYFEQADADIARTAVYREVLRDAALCETRR